MLKNIIKSAEALRLARAIRGTQLDSKYYARDIKNIVIYGIHAPRSFECIWINPYECRYTLPNRNVKMMTGAGPRKSTARVVRGTWKNEDILPFSSTEKFKFCFRHWKKNISWDNAGAIDNVMQEIRKRRKPIDNCKTQRDIELRYRQLDKIYETIQKEGSFQTRKEIEPNNFRERGGVIIHLGPAGELFFGNSGKHRLSIALLLGLYLPATIGCVHKSALKTMNELRKKKNGRPDITEHYKSFFESANLPNFRHP